MEKQSISTPIAATIIAVVVLIVGLIGWKVMSSRDGGIRTLTPAEITVAQAKDAKMHAQYNQMQGCRLSVMPGGSAQRSVIR